MPLLFADGFDLYDNGGQLQQEVADRWSVGSGSTITATTGRITGDALSLLGSNNGARYIAQLLDTPVTTELTVGFAFQNTSSTITSPTPAPIMDIRNGVNSSTVGLGLVIENDVVTVGKSQISLGNPGFTTGLDQWNYYELRVVVGEFGSYEFRVNGTVIDSQTNTDTRVSAGVSDFKAVQLSSHGFVLRFDDFYMAQDSGFLGPLHIETLRPNAIGSFSEGNPSIIASHFSLVDDNGYRDETTYVDMEQVGNKDTYGYQNKTQSGSIIAVSVVSYVQDIALGISNVKHVVISGATTVVDTGVPVDDTSFVARSAVYETDPNTASAWTDATFNAAEFGYELG